MTPGFGLAAKNAMSSAGALFQFDAHESLVLPGDFTIEFTVKNPKAGYNSEYTMDFTDKIVYETLSATSARHGIQCHGYAAIAFGGKFLKSSVADYINTNKKNVAVVRSGDTLYYYENGSLVMSGTGWQGVTLDLRGWYMSGITAGDKAGMVIDELRISRSAKYLTNYTPASAPFVLADSGVSDLHDEKKENISNKTSDYTAAGTGTYPSSKALSDAVSYLEGLISAAKPPTPDYTNAVEFSKAANANYTCPAAGWIQIRSAVFTAAATSAGYAKISINGKDIRDYYVSNSSATTYTWSNNAGSNFAGETLIQVAQGDNVKFYADGFTMSNATFEGTFVPQAA